ncbi:MAG: hypothetical protein V3U65_04685 [Granulosicoccaceae bacterium]
MTVGTLASTLAGITWEIKLWNTDHVPLRIAKIELALECGGV